MTLMKCCGEESQAKEQLIQFCVGLAIFFHFCYHYKIGNFF